MVEDLVCVRSSDTPADVPLELSEWFVVLSPTVGATFRTPTALNLRKVADGVPERDLLGVVIRPFKLKAVAERHDDETLAVLGNAVPPGLDDLGVHGVVQLLQFLDEGPEDEHLGVERHVRDVLHDDRPWSGPVDDLDVRTPEFATLVLRLAAPLFDELADAVASGLGERLARWSTCENLDTTFLHEVSDLDDRVRRRQIPVDGHSCEVVGMCLHSLGVVVYTEYHLVARFLEPQRDSTCT